MAVISLLGGLQLKVGLFDDTKGDCHNCIIFDFASDFLLKRKWKLLYSEYIIKRPWLTARRNKIELPDGWIIPEFYVLEYPEWVNVIAITTDENNKRNPSKHDDEERGLYLNWIKHNKKLYTAGELKPDRVEMFKVLLALMEENKRVNQYVKTILINTNIYNDGREPYFK